jgi:ribosomal protein S20
MIAPRNRNLEAVTTDDSVKKYVRAAKNHIKQGDYNEALEDIQTARKRVADSPTLAALEQGCEAFIEGDYMHARRILQTAHAREQNVSVKKYLRSAALRAYVAYITQPIKRAAAKLHKTAMY